MTRDATDPRLRRLLAVSGPVPWATKAPLLESLATQREWRASVREALAAAEFDVYGKRDEAAAERILAVLDRQSLS